MPALTAAIRIWPSNGETGMTMDLMSQRQQAAERSGGTSNDVVKNFVIALLDQQRIEGSILDFGAGKGELLKRLFEDKRFHPLAGVDWFERPEQLPESIAWLRQDLNENISFSQAFDTVVCSEVIEHLENPRHVFRSLAGLLRPGGTLILTMPNQESIRSYVGLLLRGHFTQFLGNCYPAHITALLRLDLTRLCTETGFSKPEFFYTNHGGVSQIPDR